MTQKSTPKKIYVVRKYIIATSIRDALSKDKTTPPDDIWLDTKPEISISNPKRVS